MEVLGIIGVLLTFAVILLIDWPKLMSTANIKKYKTVYYSIVVVAILIGVLEALHAIPDYDKSLVFFYHNLTGA